MENISAPQIHSGQIKRLEWGMGGLSAGGRTWNMVMFYGRSQSGCMYLTKMWELFTRTTRNTITNNENTMYVFFSYLFIYLNLLHIEDVFMTIYDVY